MEVHNSRKMPVTKWAGGTTTELVLFPPGASYQNRDFLFRVSTAEIEQDASDFTVLPGFERILVVLRGKVVLEHHFTGETREIPLETFEQHRFQGAWKTTSKGRVTDFNVIFSPQVQAAVRILHDEKHVLPAGQPIFLWSLEGTAELNGTVLHECDYIFEVLEVTAEVKITGRSCCVIITS